jgi:hypothetical protein
VESAPAAPPAGFPASLSPTAAPLLVELPPWPHAAASGTGVGGIPPGFLLSVPALFLAGGGLPLCGLGMPPKDVQLAAAAFLRGEEPAGHACGFAGSVAAMGVVPTIIASAPPFGAHPPSDVAAFVATSSPLAAAAPFLG